MTASIPFLKPNPPRLSTLVEKLVEIENSNVYSNYGPVNTRLEQSILRDLFDNVGACVTVCNATIGLMLAIRLSRGVTPDPRRRYALMPSFTFAATAHAAIWAGLTPLLCDIDPGTWLPSASSEDEMLERYGDEIAAIVPYATFGNNLDLKRYDAISTHYGIPIVVDAAASLGSLDDTGANFGADFRHPSVYSMHVTKTFSTAEAGLIYCADVAVVDKLRSMGNFGFEQPRVASGPGLNSKLSEIGALLALEKLHDLDAVVAHRLGVVRRYEHLLAGWTFQERVGRSDAYQFVSVLAPDGETRARMLDRLTAAGIGYGRYFDPHLADQPYFRDVCTYGDLRETQKVARSIISLPLSDSMTEADVGRVCDVLQSCRGS